MNAWAIVSIVVAIVVLVLLLFLLIWILVVGPTNCTKSCARESSGTNVEIFRAPHASDYNISLEMTNASGSVGTMFGRLPLEAIDRVDLQRYQGTWYEIFRLPFAFQQGCGRAKAEYRFDSQSGTLSVTNSCDETGPGTVRVAKGTARPAPGTRITNQSIVSPAKFIVDFGSPFPPGDYWIFSLDPDYQYALVGSSDRQTLWLLSRQPVVPTSVRQYYSSIAYQLGFPIERLV